MKRLLLIGLVVFGVGSTGLYAQNKSTYEDDIYYTSSQAQEDAAAQKKKEAAAAKEQPKAADDTYYSSTGEAADQPYGDDYIDYDDDYYFASHINRFSYPFYNRSYYSGFYNPNWYDRNWIDPTWGYNPWARPGFSISFGYGPSWSSYWGWQTWYGYDNFGSYYNYPYYATGYGNYWGGCGSGYYSGYWNGYYAGIYNGNGRNGYRTVSYGPRYSLNSVNNSYIRGNRNGFRSALTSNSSTSGNSYNPAGPRRFRMANMDNRGDLRNNEQSVRSNNSLSSQNGGGREIRRDDARTYNNGNDANGSQNATGRNEDRRPYDQSGRMDPQRQQATEPFRPSRGRFSGQEAATTNQPAAQYRMQPQRSEQPRYEQRTEQPRYERSTVQPRSESPRMGGFGGERSSGGGSNGGGGFRGRR